MSPLGMRRDRPIALTEYGEATIPDRSDLVGADPA
jgi:hypothetical protein